MECGVQITIPHVNYMYIIEGSYDGKENKGNVHCRLDYMYSEILERKEHTTRNAELTTPIQNSTAKKT